MSVADRMVVRIRGEYRSIARRQALALISAGRAERDDRARAAVTPAEQTEAPAVPADPDGAPTAQQDPQTGLDDGDPNDTPTPADEHDPELEERRRALGLKDGEWQAKRGPVVYNTPGLQEVDPGDAVVPTVEAEPLPELPRGNAGRAAWAEYAQTVLGLTVTSDQTRNDIRDAAQEAHAAALARMPQPAVADGGRLDTPEDEPATETVADDPDTRTE